MLIPKHIENFVKEMERRNFSPLTIKNYKSCLLLFLEKYKDKEHPAHIVEQDIKDYLHSFVGVNYQRATHSAIKKYFEICFNQKNKFRHIPYAKKEQRLPIIIDNLDIQKLFDVCVYMVVFIIFVSWNSLLRLQVGIIDTKLVIMAILNALTICTTKEKFLLQKE